jgi:hypothetical protein
MPFLDNELISYLEDQKLIQWYSYKSSKELESLMLLFGNEYVERVILEFNKNKVVIPEDSLNSSISHELDILLLPNGFKKTTNHKGSLEIIYDKEYMQISIRHSKPKPIVGVFIIVNGNQYSLHHTLEILNLVKRDDHDQFYFYFRKEDELKQVLKRIVEYLSLILSHEFEVLFYL